jgi:RND family efflux transporter MFP subunit
MPHCLFASCARRLAHAVASIVLVAGLAACGEPPEAAPTPSLTVETVAPRLRALAREVTASGAIAAWEEVAVGVEVSGLRVAEVMVEVGDTVRRGDVLLRLDARTLRAQAAQSEASVAEAQANAEVAAKRARRTRELAVQKFVSQQDADQAEAEAISAQAQLRTARAALQAADVQLGFTEVRAPHDGVVSARSVQPGQVAGASAELLRLIRDRRLEWRAELAEADLIRVAPGTLVRVSGPDAVAVEGHVRQVSPALDPQRRTGTVYADLPQTGNLRAGMFAAGRLVLGRGEAMVIPLEAVVRRDGRAYAYVVDAQNRARERRIDTGTTAGADIEVREGLSSGERVVARGAGFLSDGDLVRVVKAGAASSNPTAAR